MKDILSRPRVIRALVELRKVHPERLTMTQFMEVTGYFSRDARALLKDMLEWRLITIEEEPRGALVKKGIALAAGALEVADTAILLEQKAKALIQNAAPTSNPASNLDEI